MVVEKFPEYGKRFGHDVFSRTLGEISELPELKFPDIERVFSPKGNYLTYKKIKDPSDYERVAEIYRRSISEMCGTECEWHHDPGKIEEMVKTGEWEFYGCYDQEELIACESMYINRGQRSMQWVWGAGHPDHLGKNVWAHIGEFNDELVAKSGALMGRVWVVTTHNKSQRTAERAGYIPMGIDFYWLGGPDGKWYYQPILWYGKFYNVALEHLTSSDLMRLTENSKQLKEIVKKFEEQKPIEEIIIPYF